MLNEACQGTNFRLGNDAIMLVAELANYLVTETCHRAAKSAIQEGLDQITIDHVEKCMPHIVSNLVCLMLKISTISNIFCRYFNVY